MRAGRPLPPPPLTLPVCSASETGSESFQKFLTLLGDSVTLQGWAGYRGGLDTKSESHRHTTRHTHLHAAHHHRALAVSADGHGWGMAVVMGICEHLGNVFLCLY